MANLPETPQWEEGVYQIEVSDPVLGGPDGISNRQAKQLASRTSYLKQQVEKGGSDLEKHIAAADPHTQYAPKASPTFTGNPAAPTVVKTDNSTKLATTAHVKTVVADYAPLASPGLTGIPTAPTAAQTVNNTQLATTAFVKAALAALVASSPAALDTLNELAAALDNDPNFATTMTNALAGKQPLDNTLTALSGKSVAALLEYLRLGAGAPPIGIPFFWPSAAMPNTVMDEWSDMVFLKWNDATFSAATYPKLAKVIPSLKLTESRGEFIRTWDDGRGVDPGRALLSAQSFAMQNITGTLIDAKFNMNQGATGAFTLTTGGPADGAASGVGFASRVNFNAANVVKTADETRSRSIAFNFLVRAK
ncbi:phage tail protein (plasmid) [Citrobacter freundii]|uniref:phage tail protein n=1 Tax=Citrobacter freundii TaxID=546 RepID=UPI00311DE855